MVVKYLYSYENSTENYKQTLIRSTVRYYKKFCFSFMRAFTLLSKRDIVHYICLYNFIIILMFEHEYRSISVLC